MTNTVVPATRGSGPRAPVRAGAAAALALAAGSAHGSFLSGEALDTAADIMSWVVIVIVPIIGITVFWIVHVMPEKIAHRRHHPQTQAIQVLCLLSLVFGGLLWPIAWLWAYTRPVAYRIAYGTDKHDEYFTELAEKARRGEALEHELDTLRHELDSMHARGSLPPNLARLRDELDSLPPPRPADVPVAVAADARGG
jgi:hypothetical protein